jgi:hypothetical protein
LLRKKAGNAPVQLLAASLVALSAGCATAPDTTDDVVARTSAEALYNEAPWVNTAPKNIRGMSNIAVGVTQGLADISSAYSAQLEYNQLAQMQYLNNSSGVAQRSNAWRDCLGVGGGTQGGMKCESIGYVAFREEYIDVEPEKFVLADENAWPPKKTGWTEAPGPLFTEMQAIEIGQAMYSGSRGYGSISKASGKAAKAYYSR